MINTDTFVFLTTPTSATASMWRVISCLARKSIELNRFTDKFYHENSLADLEQALVPVDGRIHLHNVPHLFNSNHALDSYKFIVNVRDPRDLLCNMYHWKLVHPEPGLSDEDLQSRKHEIELKGIDDFVLRNDVTAYYSQIMSIVEKLDSSRLLFATYSNLCLDFDRLIPAFAKFLGIELTQSHWEDLSIERVENLESNESWIGTQWKGSDVLPGRHKHELKSDTIEKLNAKYDGIIRFCANADDALV